jgi:ATP-binding cassette subfamily B protein
MSSYLHQVIDFGIVGLAAYLAIQGKMSPGQVVAVSMMAANVIGPFNMLASMWSQLQQVKMVMNRLNDVFLAESERKSSKKSLIKQRLRGEIEFRDVWFRYGGEATDWILKGMSFHIPPNQSVAIVGPSGSGKSTLAFLTAGFYEPTKGTILIDGRDYRDYDKEWLRHQVGLLLQENNLFAGSIIENIAYGDPRPDMTRVEWAAETADAKGFIMEKSSGYEYLISHGGLGLSGGQKQRLAIARILYANPTILFLDEATSALDGKSEKAITEALKISSKNRTTISIAHRYGTVKKSDFALVVDDGKMVEFGTHPDLMKAGGHYAKLFGDQIAS